MRVKFSRRGVLGTLTFGSYCISNSNAASPPLDRAIAADFFEPVGSQVTLRYWDRENFQLVPLVAGTETWVLAGRIYLMVRPSIATAGVERVLWVGELHEVPPLSLSTKQSLGERIVLAADVDDWALGVPVYDVSLTINRPTQYTTKLKVARLPALAHAQYVVHCRMRAAMNMSLCGNGIDRVTGVWIPELTGAGLAVIADEGGVRMVGSPQSIKMKRSILPASIVVEDYRLLPAR